MSAAPATPETVVAISVRRRNLSMVAVLLSMLMANLDSSIVNVALPQLSRDLRVAPADTIWVATAYLLAVACALPATSGLADQIGRKRMLLIGTPLFTLSSFVCGASPTLGVLITSRVVQGASAACIFAVAIPIYRRLFPPERLGFVLGINAMTVALGISAGPALGGLILANLSWPWLFWMNVPFGIIATVLAVLFLPHRQPHRGDFDVRGSLLAAAAIGSFLVGVHQLADVSTLWIAVVLLAASVVLGVAFVRAERRSIRPVLPIGLFNGPFTLAILTAFWSFFGQGVAFVALPFLFQTEYHATPLQSALLFTPWPLVIVIVAPISGRLADRYSTARLSVIGLSIFSVGLLSLTVLGRDLVVWQVLASTALTGLGFAVFQSPNNRDMMAASPMKFASAAAGALNLNRTLAQSAGAGAVSMALVLVGASMASLDSQAQAARSVMVVAVAGAVLSVIVSALKLRRSGAPRVSASSPSA